MAIGGGASGPWGTAPMLMLNSRGKRFMNEGAIAQMQATCLRQPAGLACYVTDANWAKTLKAAPLDHGAPNFGMQDYWDKIEQDMNNTVSGQANTITIANLAERTQMAGTIYRADTLEELADLLGYKGAAKQNFLDSIAHYNELCYAGVDSDYGKDAPYMVPIDTAPFFGGTSSTGHSSNPMMVTMSGVITDESQAACPTTAADHLRTRGHSDHAPGHKDVLQSRPVKSGNTHTASNCWPCRFCNAVENRTGLCSSGRVEHNPVLPDCKGTIYCDWFRIMHVK